MASGKILKRIASLQNLAKGVTSDDAATRTEAYAAAEQAGRLQREHAVAQSEIDAVTALAQDPLVQQECALEGDRMVLYENRNGCAKTAEWKRLLAFAICEYFGIRGAYFDARPWFDLMGHLSDCNATRELYNTCARQIVRECKAWSAREAASRRAAGEWPLSKGEGRTAACSFKTTAVRGLSAKFKELQAESAADLANNDGTALVQTRKQQVEDWVEANYTFTKGREVGADAEWNAAGFAAGRSLSLIPDGGLEDRRKVLAG